MEDLDFGIINGNFIVASGKKLKDALVLENPPKQHRIIVTVRTEDKDKQFVKDIIEAYHSPEFKELIYTNKYYEGFYLPDYVK